MANTKKTKGTTGNRYTPAFKQKVVNFINSKNGAHGIMGEAQKKFGISYIALRSWLKKSSDETAPETKVKSANMETPKSTREKASENSSGIKKMILDIESGIQSIKENSAAQILEMESKIEKMKEFFGV